MTILLIIFWFNVLSAFISAATARLFWCVVNVVLAVLMAFLAIAYEGRLINRIQKLEREISAQINANEVMRSKSLHKATQITLR